ncbi:anti-repressor SinI family protein [Bacillota bacterium Lsc_1132]
MLRLPSCLEYDSYFRGENVVKTDLLVEEIDTEWIKLMLEAKKIGITKDIVREFLNKNGIRETYIKNSSTT